MQNTESDKYSDLLDDELFIEWILFPTEDLNIYWNQRIANDPDLLSEIESLKYIIKNLQTEKRQLSEDSKSRIWNNLQKNRKTVTKNRYRTLLIRISTSAAVILLVISGIFFFKYGQKTVVEINYQSILAKNNIDEQSESIELILDHKSRVKIDTTNVDIVYSGTGEININSEKIDKSPGVQLNQLIVPYGKTSSITLSDGSKIWVNSGSRLIYPLVFDGEKREIYVEGEIYIEVEKKEQPFLIKTGKLDVRVLGTKFNVSAYRHDEEHSVVLVSGSVAIEDKATSNTNKISPDQKYAYNTQKGSAVIQNVDVNEYISWKSGFLTLKSQDLNTVLNKLRRYYNVTFLYNKDDIKNIRVSGKLNLKDNIDDILRAISITTPINYEISGKTIKLKF